jgi:hypothetical protein
MKSNRSQSNKAHAEAGSGKDRSDAACGRQLGTRRAGQTMRRIRNRPSPARRSASAPQLEIPLGLQGLGDRHIYQRIVSNNEQPPMQPRRQYCFADAIRDRTAPINHASFSFKILANY